MDLDRLPNVDFRPDHQRGRVVWTVDGEDYTKQFFPPNLTGLAYPPHSLIAEMDYAGVDMALLHTDPMLGRDSAYLGECVRQYPGRLTSMAPVDEWRIKDETEAVIGELEHAINDLGLHAIKFIPQLAYRVSPAPWDDGYFRPFWEAATRLNVPVFFTLGTGPAALHGNASPDQQRQRYLEELAILMRWMARYPDTPCSLTHGFPYRLFLEGDRLLFPDVVWEPFRAGNCHLEVCFPIRLGDLFDFPYREVWPALEQMVKEIGAERLLWGTDMPFQNRFCTYRQSRRWIEQYCAFLGQDELAALMGGTAQRLLGV
jgi:predicted TIM-barrel fold metal-dependent hydrolase